jgi:hypothetical protein
MAPESAYSVRRLEAVDKQRRALELRKAGRTWVEIARVVGYKNHSGAIAAVKVALEKTLQEPSEHYRALTLERLTDVIRVYWGDMLNHDLRATDRVLRAIADIRALLGLDAPIKEEVSISGRIEHDYRSELDARIYALVERREEAASFEFPEPRGKSVPPVRLDSLGQGESNSTNGSVVHLDAPDGTWRREDS